MKKYGLLKWNFGYVGYLEPSVCDKKDGGFIKGMFEKEISLTKLSNHQTSWMISGDLEPF